MERVYTDVSRNAMFTGDFWLNETGWNELKFHYGGLRLRHSTL